MTEGTIDSLYKSMDRNLNLIAKGLAVLCLSQPAVEEASQAERALLLKSIGFSNSEIADVLQTNSDVVKTQLSVLRRKSKLNKGRGNDENRS